MSSPSSTFAIGSVFWLRCITLSVKSCSFWANVICAVAGKTPITYIECETDSALSILMCN